MQQLSQYRDPIMPTLAIERDVLVAHIGRSYTEEELNEVCFEFGVELDEITSECEEASKSATTRLSKEELEALLDSVVYKIDVPANQHDLLCVEGLSRVLWVFFGEMDSPNYTFANPASGILETMMVVYSSTFKIRPFVICVGRCFSCMFDSQPPSLSQDT